MKRDRAPHTRAFSSEYPSIARALKMLGKRRISRVFGVSVAQLNRALSGNEPLPAAASVCANDFDRVLARAFEIFQSSVILDWLEGTERTLGFAQPINAFSVVGAKPLLDVLDRIAAGGYA